MTAIFGWLGIFSIAAAPFVAWKRGAPKSVPWRWALALWLALLAGSFIRPLGIFERVYYFTVLLAVTVVASHIPRAVLRPMQIGFGLFLAGYAALDAFHFIPAVEPSLGIIRRPYALDHPNLVASWSLLLPFGAWTVITALVTQSRGALLGLIAVLAVRRVPRRLMALAVLAGVAFFAIRPGTAIDRVNFWREGLTFFASRPLTGWGTGSFRTSLEVPSAVDALLPERTGMHTAHNAAITIAAENGLLGLIPFVGFALGIFRSARTSHGAAKWSLLAFAVQQAVDDQWLHPITSVVLGVCLGRIFSKA